MKHFKWLAAISLAFAVVCCCPCRKSTSPKVPFLGTEWKLAQFYDEVVDSENYRVTFSADGSVRGMGGCNSFSGTFTQSGRQIKVAGDIVATRMLCPDQPREDKFLKMLTQADSYSIDGLRLMLIRGGDVLAIFDPAGDYQLIMPNRASQMRAH